MKVKIAHLYYDLMNLYGEQGNIIALKESLKNQNIETEIDLLSIGDDINFKDYDIFYIGTGSKESLLLTLEDIKKYTKDIKSAIKGGKVFISTGHSHELFGKSLTYNNIEYDGLKLFPYYSKEANERITGECTMHYDNLENNIIGFQNRASLIQIDNNHLFTLIKGDADNKKSTYEGYTENNFYGTYLIGPLLIRNPHLTDYIVKKLLEEKGMKFHEDKDTPLYRAYQEYNKNFPN